MPHQPESNPFGKMIQVLDEHGFAGLARALEILFNEAMKIERSEVLRAQPHQRTETRRGYANGFKPKNPRNAIFRAGDFFPAPSRLKSGRRAFLAN